MRSATALRMTTDFIFWTRRRCEISNSTEKDYKLQPRDRTGDLSMARERRSRRIPEVRPCDVFGQENNTSNYMVSIYERLCHLTSGTSFRMLFTERVVFIERKLSSDIVIRTKRFMFTEKTDLDQHTYTDRERLYTNTDIQRENAIRRRTKVDRQTIIGDRQHNSRI